MNRIATQLLERIVKLLPNQKRQGLLFALFRSLDETMDTPTRWRMRKVLFDKYFQSWPVEKSDQALRFYGFFRLVENTLSVPGDIVECGVGRGQSLITLCYAASFFGADKSVYGFDSFSGFPEAVVQDLSDRVKSVGKVAGWTDTSPQIMCDALELDTTGNPNSLLLKDKVNLKLRAGFFDESLPSYLPDRIALLHVDCDLYASTREVLINCLPRMSSGGVIILDEYADQRWPGAKKAVDEVCTANGLVPQYSRELQRYCIHMALPEQDLLPSVARAH